MPTTGVGGVEAKTAWRELVKPAQGVHDRDASRQQRRVRRARRVADVGDGGAVEVGRHGWVSPFSFLRWILGRGCRSLLPAWMSRAWAQRSGAGDGAGSRRGWPRRSLWRR